MSGDVVIFFVLSWRHLLRLPLASLDKYGKEPDDRSNYSQKRRHLASAGSCIPADADANEVFDASKRRHRQTCRRGRPYPRVGRIRLLQSSVKFHSFQEFDYRLSSVLGGKKKKIHTGTILKKKKKIDSKPTFFHYGLNRFFFFLNRSVSPKQMDNLQTNKPDTCIYK